MYSRTSARRYELTPEQRARTKAAGVKFDAAVDKAGARLSAGARSHMFQFYHLTINKLEATRNTIADLTGLPPAEQEIVIDMFTALDDVMTATPHGDRLHWQLKMI